MEAQLGFLPRLGHSAPPSSPTPPLAQHCFPEPLIEAAVALAARPKPDPSFQPGTHHNNRTGLGWPWHLPLISRSQAFVRWTMRNGHLASTRSPLPRGLAELQLGVQLPGAAEQHGGD